jgi:hypothetical protein
MGDPMGTDDFRSVLETSRSSELGIGIAIVLDYLGDVAVEAERRTPIARSPKRSTGKPLLSGQLITIPTAFKRQMQQHARPRVMPNALLI